MRRFWVTLVSHGKNSLQTEAKKTTFTEEQRLKDLEFLKLKPAERLRLHEVMRKRIWGDKYNKLSLKGLKVKKKNFA